MSRSTIVRAAIFLATVVGSWALLSLGVAAEAPDLEVGQPAPMDFLAEQQNDVPNLAATEAARQAARDAVPPPRESNVEVESNAISSVQSLFDDLETLVVGDDPRDQVAAVPELPESEPTSTTQADSEATTTTQPPQPAVLAGVVYIDADADGQFNPDSGLARADVGLNRVTIRVSVEGGTDEVLTSETGAWAYEYPGGPAVVVVDTGDSDIPDGYYHTAEGPGVLIECDAGSVCETDPAGFQVSVRPIAEVTEVLVATHAEPQETISYLAGVAADDLTRSALGETLHLPTLRREAVNSLTLEFAGRIEPEQLQSAVADVRLNPRPIFHEDTGLDQEGSEAVAEVVATNLAANYLINQEEWQRLQDEAAAAEPEIEESYAPGELIVSVGVPLTQLHIDAIELTAVPTLDQQPSSGLLAVVVVLVGLLWLYLATFRPEFWARPRMVALLGIVIVLIAAAVRGTVAVEDRFTWYVLPAVAFGFITAVLFDQRIAVLVALAVGVLTALGTLDVGATVYASLAALVPIPFVSSVSTRGSFRNSVILSSIVAALAAGAAAWFFTPGTEDLSNAIPEALAYGFGVSVVASLVGLAALQFFESAFDITTTLGLLDLTDRNHKALQVLQDQAFGTFNHSLMVGTLADAAARSIGANALLARAMAYYHDLGKTENPTFFIENQAGMRNPHDDLDPVESAEIIRSHVTSGVALAREYKIPTEVAEGIVSHHGDGVMRYFYEKAREMHGDADIDDFRHVGHKPRRAETAILMLADALEAACRAVFQAEDPTPEAIEKVVDRVVDEKVDDGQLSESPLTLAQLTKIRKAFLDSLVGHYHQRIAYPNFPGT